MEIQVDGSICRLQNHLKFSLSEKELSILRLNTLEGGRFCISQSMHNVKSCSALCLAHNFFMRPSRKAPSKDVQYVLLNFFFSQHQSYCFGKKTKALLLLQIDETYNQAIAAMECVFLRYIDKCKFRSYRERLFGSYNTR